MLLVFDIGNSSINIGIYQLSKDKNEIPKIKYSVKISSDKLKTADEYVMLIFSLIKMSPYEINDISNVVISSVVPLLTRVIADSTEKLFSVSAIIIAPGLKNGLRIKTDNPAEVGADIICTSVAALHIAEPPLLILDMGTATTLTLISSNKELIGTTICPGMETGLKSLIDSTSLINETYISPVQSLIGTNTTASVKSGIYYGNLFMVDGLTDRIKSDINNSVSLLATGGLANLLVPNLKNKFKYIENLTLLGAAIIFQKNFV